jgi:maltose phosphorylase
LRTSRLDLDDYNHEADEGLHITSMAGTWMAIVEGMAGIRVFSDSIEINPVIPANWQKYSFQILVRNQPLHIRVSQHECEIINKGNHSLEIRVYEEKIYVQPDKSYLIKTTKTSAL